MPNLPALFSDFAATVHLKILPGDTKKGYPRPIRIMKCVRCSSMTVRVTLIDGGRVVEIKASGQATRREAGWATERARELSSHPEVTAILADCRESGRQKSPQLSAEMIENFLFALERRLPSAYVMPEAWDANYEMAVREDIIELPPHARFFIDRDSALRWLASHPAS